jgi:TP901 family phage tail tape measure protein
MGDTLNVSLIIRAIDRASAPIRKVTKNFEAMRVASARASKAFKVSADIRQAAEGMSRFARVARGIAGAPVTAFVDFQAAMSGVKAVTGGILPAQFAQLTANAKELGATTRFTAVQAAEGFKFFGIAGWNAAEQMEALPAAMNLSVASGTDLGRTADILSDIMGAFGKEADQAANVSDQLAYTLSNSNTTMETLFETMKVAGPIASDLKFSMSDVAAMTGIMGSAGIKGSLAGTALRSAMLKLASPSKTASTMLKKLGITIVDESGNVRNMVDVFAEVADKTEGMGTALRTTFLKELTGLRAVSGISKLMSAGGDAIRKFSAGAAGASGRAKEMAKIMDDNLKGSFVLLTSALDGFLTAVGEQLEPMLTSLVNTITRVVQSVTSWAVEHPTLTKVIAITTAAIAALATGLTGILFTLAAATSAFGVLTLSIGGQKTAVQLLSAAYKRLTVRTAAWEVVSSRSGAMMPVVEKGFIGMTGSVLRAIPAFIGLKISAWAAAIGVNAAIWPVTAVVAAIVAVTAAVVLAIVYWDKIVAVWERLKNASLATKIVLGILLAPLLLLLSPILAIAWAANKIIDNWEPIKKFFSDIWASIIGGVKKAILWLEKVKLPAPLRTFMDHWLGGAKLVGGAVSSAAGAVADVGREMAWVAGAGEGTGEQAAAGGLMSRTEGGSNLGEGKVVIEFRNGIPVPVETDSSGGLGLEVETGALLPTGAL